MKRVYKYNSTDLFCEYEDKNKSSFLSFTVYNTELKIEDINAENVIDIFYHL